MRNIVNNPGGNTGTNAGMMHVQAHLNTVSRAGATYSRLMHTSHSPTSSHGRSCEDVTCQRTGRKAGTYLLSFCFQRNLGEMLRCGTPIGAPLHLSVAAGHRQESPAISVSAQAFT